MVNELFNLKALSYKNARTSSPIKFRTIGVSSPNQIKSYSLARFCLRSTSRKKKRLKRIKEVTSCEIPIEDQIKVKLSNWSTESQQRHGFDICRNSQSKRTFMKRSVGLGNILI